MDNSTDVISIASSGRSALERSSRRLTFSPRPTMAIVSKKPVRVEIPLRDVSFTGIQFPNA